jgi:hypothetical protein
MADCSAVLDAMPEVSINSITLATAGDPQVRSGELRRTEFGSYSLTDEDQATTAISIRCSLQEQVSQESAQWYQQSNMIDFLRMRVVVCMNETEFEEGVIEFPQVRNAPSLDYITQRLNEYGETGGEFTELAYGDNFGGINIPGAGNRRGSLIISPRHYLRLIMKSLNFGDTRQNAQVTAIGGGQVSSGTMFPTPRSNWLLRAGTGEGYESLTDTYKPYDSSAASIFFNVDNASIMAYRTRYEGSPSIVNKLGDLVLFDKNVRSLLPSDDSGNIISRRIQRTSPPTGDETSSTLVYEDIPVPPIEFTIGPESDIGYLNAQLEHLSVYAYVYLDYDGFLESLGLDLNPNQVDTSFITGAGNYSSATVLGNKYIYTPLPTEGPTVSNLIENSRILEKVSESPDRDILQDIRRQNLPILDRTTTNFHENIFKSTDGSALDQSPTGKLIHKEDFFSDIWITKDLDENARYMFAFNIARFLNQKAQFPRLYENTRAIEELCIEGFEFQGQEYRSEVKDMRMGKCPLDQVGYASTNDLGTSAQTKKKGKTYTYAEEMIESPVIVDDLLILEGDAFQSGALGVSFYEGTDSYSQDKISERTGAYQYFAIPTVVDTSKVMMIKAATELQTAQNMIDDLLEFVLDSNRGYYNSRAGLLNVGLEEINENPGNNLDVPPTATAYVYGLRAINIYIRYLRLLNIKISDLAMVGQDEPWEDIRELLILLLRSRIPAVINSVKEAIGMLSQAVSEKVSTFVNGASSLSPLGSNEDIFDYSEAAIYRRGLLEHRFVVVDYKNYFATPYSFGYHNNLGYSYILRSDLEKDGRGHLRGEPESVLKRGFARVEVQAYVNRLQQELDKYFYQEPAQPPPPGTPFGGGPLGDIGQSLNESAYQYLTPAYVFTPAPALEEGQLLPPITKNVLSQLQNLDTTILDFDMNNYARLFAYLIRSKYAAKYLNLIFFSHSPEVGSFPPNKQTFNSVIGLLDQEHACQVSTQVIPQYNIPDPSFYNDEVDPRTGLSEAEERLGTGGGVRTDDSRINLPQGVLGGASDQSAPTTNYYRTVTETFLEEDQAEQNQQGDLYESQDAKDDTTPIKLAFGILGELELDSTLNINSYQEEEFNSLHALGSMLGVTPNTLEPDFNYRPDGLPGRLTHLPNQLKAMTIAALSNQDQNSRVDYIYNTKRAKLLDNDSPEYPNELSYYNAAVPGNPPYPFAYDPMKIYMKFLTFWLTYKQIGTIEYLAGFQSTNPPSIPQNSVANKNCPLLPIWKQVDQQLIQRLQEISQNNISPTADTQIMCRVKQYDPHDILRGGVLDFTGERGTAQEDDLPSLTPPGLDPIVDPTSLSSADIEKIFSRNEILNLPVYHQYFMLGTKT